MKFAIYFLIEVGEFLLDPSSMRDVFSLRIFEEEEKLSSFGRVVTVALQFRNPTPLLGNQAFALCNVPVSHCEVPFNHRAVHQPYVAA